MAASRLGIPGPSSSKMRRKPTPRSASVGCAIRRPRLAYLTTLRASSEVTVASRVWSIRRKPRAAASRRTSPRAIIMSCSLSREIDLAFKRGELPVRVFALVAGVKLRAQELETLVHIEDSFDAFQLEAELDERDCARRLHADDDRARIHDPRHRRDVREHAPDK